MAFDIELAKRIKVHLKGTPGLDEKKMFGGLCILIGGNMALGIIGNKIMVRVGKENYEKALLLPGASPMDFTGKALTGMVYVSPHEIASQKTLKKWIKMGVDFASSLPPKKKSTKKS